MSSNVKITAIFVWYIKLPFWTVDYIVI